MKRARSDGAAKAALVSARMGSCWSKGTRRRRYDAHGVPSTDRPGAVIQNDDFMTLPNCVLYGDRRLLAAVVWLVE